MNDEGFSSIVFCLYPQYFKELMYCLWSFITVAIIILVIWIYFEVKTTNIFEKLHNDINKYFNNNDDKN